MMIIIITMKKTNSLIGERTGKIYRIGDKLEAVVVRADKLRMEVDFVPYVEDELAKYSQQYPNAKIKGLKKNNKISKKKKKISYGGIKLDIVATITEELNIKDIKQKIP